MAEHHRRSVRNRISNRNSDYIYDSEELNFIRGENSQHNQNSNVQLPIDNNNYLLEEIPLGWSDIYRLLPVEDEVTRNYMQNYLELEPQERSASQSEQQNTPVAEDALAQNVNIDVCAQH